jgi:hypothetical protein
MAACRQSCPRDTGRRQQEHCRITGGSSYLLQTELGVQHPQGGVVVYAKVASQSIERAQSYARAFARVLALNGVSSSVESYYS